MRDDHDTFRHLRLALNGTPLRDLLAACGEVRRSPNNTYRYRCGQPACLWCRRRYVHWATRELGAAFGRCAPSRLVWFTLSAPATDRVSEVFVAYRKLRQAVRNACRDPLLEPLRAYGTLTPTPLPARLIADADQHFPPDQPLWHPELHGLAELPVGIARQDFGRLLANSPRLGLRVRTGEFASSPAVGLQVAAHMSRPFALYAASPVLDGENPSLSWPLDWACAYFSGLHDVGGGFRTLTFRRGLRVPQEPASPAPITEIEPLPILIEHQPWMSGWW